MFAAMLIKLSLYHETEFDCGFEFTTLADLIRKSEKL